MNESSEMGVGVRGNPLVSVIIPTYNRSGVICRTIDNVLSQTCRDIEVIVVDDGSTDDTLEKLSRYSGQIRVISQPNAGPAKARNRGIEVAVGEFVAFQDSDDLWASNKLERQVDLLKRADRSVVCCLCNAIFRYEGRPEFTSFQRAWLFPSCDEGIWINVADVLATRFVLFCQTVMIRREVLTRIGGFDETLKYHEDYELPLRLSLEGPWAFIGEPLTIWQQGAAGSWSEKALNEEIHLKECEIRMRNKILERVGDIREYRSLRKLLRRELARNRRELWRARLTGQSRPGSATVVGILARFDRYCWAVYRRLPCYPRLEAQAVHSQLSRSQCSMNGRAPISSAEKMGE
jgi:glycosyltransferase involved in cell wall biosynthesis